MVATRGQRAAAAEANFDLDEVIGTPTRRRMETTTTNHWNATTPTTSSTTSATTKNGIRFRNAATTSATTTSHYDTGKKVYPTTTTAAATTTTAMEEQPESQFSQYRSYFILLLFVMITYFAYPTTTTTSSSSSSHSQDENINYHYDQQQQPPSIHTVFYYGWISAISTGLGVLPLCFVHKLNEYYIGLANAIAAGMMCAASYSLFLEGCTFHDVHDTSYYSPIARTGLGCLLGLVFILCTKKFLDTHEEEVQLLDRLQGCGADARKLILIIFVMTLHSFSEGVGIGVSFGGEHGKEFGKFISASLAVHNVPEGLAVAIALLPRRVSKATTAIWCVVTSLPQPIMAVPAFLFVHSFLPLLPVGLGFAGGAMIWVAFMELLVEAYEDTKDMKMTGLVSVISLGVMISIQRSME